MSLNIKMAPFERICIGTSTITNCWPEPTKFKIDGNAPVLRQVYTMLDDRADTPLKKVYLCVQKMYLGFEDVTYDQYELAVERLMADMPSAAHTVRKANAKIADGNLFGAIQEYRNLLNTAHSTSRDWTAEFTGQFQPKIDPNDPLCESMVIRAQRRGREMRQKRPANSESAT